MSFHAMARAHWNIYIVPQSRFIRKKAFNSGEERVNSEHVNECPSLNSGYFLILVSIGPRAGRHHGARIKLTKWHWVFTFAALFLHYTRHCTYKTNNQHWLMLRLWKNWTHPWSLLLPSDDMIRRKASFLRRHSVRMTIRRIALRTTPSTSSNLLNWWVLSWA